MSLVFPRLSRGFASHSGHSTISRRFYRSFQAVKKFLHTFPVSRWFYKPLQQDRVISGGEDGSTVIPDHQKSTEIPGSQEGFTSLSRESREFCKLIQTVGKVLVILGSQEGSTVILGSQEGSTGHYRQSRRLYSHSRHTRILLFFSHRLANIVFCDM